MKLPVALISAAALFCCAAIAREHTHKDAVEFQTSDRCLACHNGLTTPSGRDVSIGLEWRASIMGNASRDPYWQASVRRESIDHPESRNVVEDDCSICHMPITRYQAKLKGEEGKIFSHLPFDHDKKQGHEAEDGVTCSVCHQIADQKLGTRASFNGGFVVNPPASKDDHPEYGPFDIEHGQQRVMHTSSGGFLPHKGDQIRSSELCATCHTLYTVALGPKGEHVGELAEQVPYQEWLHSKYRDEQSCQQCHMPKVDEPVQIARVLGEPREGLHQHVFVAANFFMQDMLNRYRDDLSVAALPQELTAAAEGTRAYLQQRAARIRLNNIQLTGGRLAADVFVENLGGHKLPTAYPARRAWVHFLVRDAAGHVLFESGALHADGSIEGNDNDADGSKFEPHYRAIRSSDQVEIYESILGDAAGRVTTGLLTGVRYLKDNRILPHGFDKTTADPDVAVRGDAFDDPAFTGEGSRIRYDVTLGSHTGPVSITAELWYQPIGFRWANNLKPYRTAAEPARFTSYYDSMGAATAIDLASVQTTAGQDH